MLIECLSTRLLVLLHRLRSQQGHKFDFVVSKNQEVKPWVLGLSHQYSTTELRPMVVHQPVTAGFSLSSITTLHQICFYFQPISATVPVIQVSIPSQCVINAWVLCSLRMNLITMHSSLSDNSFTATALFQKQFQ